ncbi:MAG: amino acid adenylation domain-containing protein, partial [bacterium]|nr:amino acid adenylation domain-containing protein [bacterium]
MKKLDGKNIEDILALTPMQEGMLFLYLKEPHSRHYFEQLCLHISGRIRHPLFEQAWKRVIQRNQMLRTLFRWEKLGAPSQVILKQFTLEPVYIDLSDQEANQKESALEEVKNRDMAQAFDLTRVPFRVILCKLSDQKYVMIISNHHILYDGWSTGLILKEFFEAYTAVCSGDGGLPLSVKTPFKEFVKWVREQDTGSQKEYWQNYLKGIDSGTRLPVKREVGETSSVSYRVTLSKERSRQLTEFAEKNKVTAASLFYGAWGILLQKYTRGFDVLFGTTVSGRSAKVKGIEDMVGLFINTLPLRVERRAGETIVGMLRRISDTLQVREPYESTSNADITGYSPLDNKEALYDSIVILENYPLAGLLTVENTPLKVESYTMVESAPYDLTVGITLYDGIKIDFSYDKGIFSGDTIVRLSNHFELILQGIIENPAGEVAHLEIISEEEKRRLLFDFSGPGVPYPREKTIHRLFEEQAARTPDAAALHMTDMTDMTYNELNRISNHLACLLKEKGVGPGTIVAIMMERTPGLLSGILGILKAGGAYLPIDPAFPRDRIDYMLKDSNACFFLTGESEIFRPGSRIHHPTTRNSQPATSLAYIIYTSGSSGNPKGVLIEHAQLINFVYHMYNCFNRDFGTHDRCLSLTNITFDVSVCELFLPLSFGSCVVLLPDEEKSNVYDLAGIIREKEITFAYIPPGLLKELNTELRSWVSRLSLDKMLVGVEPIPDNLLEDYLLLNPSMQIINGYGPTETTICSTTYRYRSHEPEGKTVPIGRPLSNTTILLLDRDGHPVPVGIPGEICIGGAGVGRGYLNRPELTAEKFCLRRPGGSTPLYRTGDLARWLPCGNIQFVGRIDQQVKIRGHRVELGEIENQLLRHPEIEKAVVIAGGTGNRDKYLCAYVVPGSAVSLESSRLRSYLSGRLPRYMIPSYFVQLEEIPLTPSGKVNRKELPGIEIKPGETYTAPGDDVERTLVEIWGEVLDVESSHIGMEDDFFNLGGHSLKATALISKIHKKMDIKVPLDFLFENPTVGRLARYVKKVEKDRYVSIPEAEKREYYPLSAAQKRLYITHHMEFEGLAYNVQNVVELHGTFSRVKLEETFRKLIALGGKRWLRSYGRGSLGKMLEGMPSRHWKFLEKRCRNYLETKR